MDTPILMVIATPMDTPILMITIMPMDTPILMITTMPMATPMNMVNVSILTAMLICKVFYESILHIFICPFLLIHFALIIVHSLFY